MEKRATCGWRRVMPWPFVTVSPTKSLFVLGATASAGRMVNPVQMSLRKVAQAIGPLPHLGDAGRKLFLENEEEAITYVR